MSRSAEEIRAIVSRAREFYERERVRLEADELYRYICVNADNGKYVLGDTVDAVIRAYEKKYGDMPSWVTQIGNPNYIWTSATRLSQFA